MAANTAEPQTTDLNTEASKCITSTYTFRLTNYEQHKQDHDDTIYSDAFYTSPTGYKMCIVIDAHGAGAGDGTHVTVSAHLMKGDNDDSLTWPFTGKVTVELLNQLEDDNSYVGTITFRADNVASQRVEDGERGEVWGLPQFIPHTDLDYNPDDNCQYLKDDTLIFRISVQVPDYENTSQQFISKQVCTPKQMKDSREKFRLLKDHTGVKDEQLDQEFDSTNRIYIAKILADNDWIKYANAFQLTSAEVTNIEDNTRLDECLKAHQVLQKWYQKNSFLATYRVLIETCLKFNDVQAAREICRHSWWKLIAGLILLTCIGVYCFTVCKTDLDQHCLQQCCPTVYNYTIGPVSRKIFPKPKLTWIDPSEKPKMYELRNFRSINSHESIDIVQKIAGQDYTRFGTILLNDEDGTILSAKERSQRGDPVPIVREIFAKWLQSGTATWQTLVQTLRDSEHNQLANMVESNYRHKVKISL